ncbi:MAG: MBL fold metallo-hydrolase [Caldilineaceae bacterium]
MANLELRPCQVGPWPMNTYALVCPATKQSVLFDPGADPETLLALLTDTTPIAILLTHTHGDHIGALAEMRQQLAVPVMAHPNASRRDIRADRWLEQGDSVQVGNHTLNVLYAPGHIDDQLCFVLADDERVIVGDTIFAGGPGRTRSSADFQTTLNTLRTVVLPWPDETICYPGHGPSFRLGDIRPAVEAFVNKDHGTFHGDAEWDM